MEPFELILDNCLNQLASGVSTLDECLARYPERAAELRPLLRIAAGFEGARDLRPSPAFKARTRAKLTLHMQALPRRRSVFIPFLRVAFAMSALVLIFLSAGTALAQRAMPGDLLYDWKLTSEEIWRATASDSLEADLFLADRRVNEMLSVAGDAPAYNLALQGYLDVLARLAVYTDAASQARILPVLMSQQELFGNAGISVPELDSVIDLEEIPSTPASLPDPTQVVPSLIPTLMPTPIPTILPTLNPTPIPTIVPTVGVPTVKVPTLPVPTLPPLPLP
jgi:hypothetical protein